MKLKADEVFEKVDFSESYQIESQRLDASKVIFEGKMSVVDPLHI